MMLNLLLDLSWSVNWEKSSLKPSQTKEFLGLTVNTSAKPRFWVPAAKSHTLHHNISHLIHTAHSHGSVPVHQAAAVAGHCVSLAHTVLPAHLLLQNLYHNISHQMGWNSQIRLSEEAIHDLEEWQAGLLKWDSHMASIHPANVVLKTNASLSGWGAALKGSSITSASWWRKHSQHINKLKLKAILQALQSLAPVLHNQSVLMHCNNMTAVAYINHLSGHSMAMNRTTHKIFNLCQHLAIHISTAHLPSKQNSQANHLSQLFPQHKWSITPHLFNSLNQMWGPHSINHMVSAHNTILPHFNKDGMDGGPARAPVQPLVVLGSLQDLWLHRMEGWSPAVLMALDLALAPLTWCSYCSSLVQFRDFCWENGVPFPPEVSQATATITNFIEVATHTSQ
jgi:hypothetical protein